MRISDIIRGVLDIIDNAEAPEQTAQVTVVAAPTQDQEMEDAGALLRMKQIAGLVGTGNTEYSNSPEEMITDIDAVLQSGDDVHHSKNPADIRTNAPSMYPDFQARG